MIGVRRIPIERVGDGAFGKPQTNDESAIGSLFGMDGEPVVHRRVRRHYNCPGGYNQTFVGFDVPGSSVLEFLRMGFVEDAPAVGPRYGTLGRNVFRGPAYNGVNASLFKS